MAGSVEESRKIILAEEIDYAIVDLKVDPQSEYGGVEVVNFLKRHRPDSKAMFLSAYSLDDQIKAELKVGIDVCVPKGGPANYILAVFDALAQILAQAFAADLTAWPGPAEAPSTFLFRGGLR